MLTFIFQFLFFEYYKYPVCWDNTLNTGMIISNNREWIGGVGFLLKMGILYMNEKQCL